MRLCKISIYNFHGIEYLELNLHDFTSIIGKNNSGKSTILRAIDLFLNQMKPDFDEWRRGYEKTPIEIECLFDKILDWERDIPGISGLINADQIRLRFIASVEDDKVKVNYEAHIRDEQIQGWSDSWGEISQEIKDIATINEINGTGFRNKSNKERLRSILRRERPELIETGNARWTDESISILGALKQGLPQVVFIPAVRDAIEETKTTSKTAFGILINKLILPAIKETTEYQNIVTAVEDLSKKISNEGEDSLTVVDNLMKDISGRLNSIMSARALISLNLPDSSKFVGANTILKIDDGTETSIIHQGHGMQRSFLFALIETLANLEAKSTHQEEDKVRSSILLFEEPELFLHPHLMRRLKSALKGISYSASWQVCITTHSPFLIDVIDNPPSLVILQKPDPNLYPECCQLMIDPFIEDGLVDEKTALRASLDFNPTVNEVFFAKRVLLVEGDTELAVFNHELKPHLKFEITDEEFDHTSIVSCGGKWTIPAIARLLCKFDIPFRILHDADVKGRTQRELEECHNLDPYNANEKIKNSAGENLIYLVDDTFEHILWDARISRSSKNKPYASWKKIRDWVNERDTVFDEDKLREIFEFAFKW